MASSAAVCRAPAGGRSAVPAARAAAAADRAAAAGTSASGGLSTVMSEQEQLRAIVTDLLDRFMAALNAHDAAGMDACMHFPHVRIAEGKVVVYDRPGRNPMDLFQRLQAEDGWHHSAWNHRRIVQHGPDKMHLDVRYTRFRADGSVIGVYDSLYIATLSEGTWGIQARSSFGP